MPWTANDVDWVAARLLPEVYDINQRIKYDRNTRRLKWLLEELEHPMSVIDRIKAKALEARSISADAIRDFEADLDGLIAEKPKLQSKRAEALAPHKEVFRGIYGELDGLKQAMDLLSNGGPSLDPLHISETAAPSSEVHAEPVDINARRDRPRV